MGKILTIALREFLSTVLTKGFIIGLLAGPLVAVVGIVAATSLISDKPPAVKGTVVVIDRTGEVRPALERRFSAEELQKVADEERAQAQRAAEKIAEQTGPGSGAATGKLAERALSLDTPQLSVEFLEAGAEAEGAKQRLLTGTLFDGSTLAVLVVTDGALGDGTMPPGSVELFIKQRMDVRVQQLIAGQARAALVDARLARAGEDPARIRGLVNVPTPRAVAMTSEGERSAGALQQMLIPLAFMLLLWISTFTGGQYLLTSTIEEKSNRVMEVLLSAVSPTQLMAGKILGQMSAGLVVLVLYSGLGMVSLLLLDRGDLISPLNLVFLILFFFIAFFLIGSLMAAVGSAVTDVHEAQTLLGPVMLVIAAPMFLMMPIIFSPSGTLAVTLSFVPPFNPFVMILRLASTEPPPMWQTLLSLVIGVGAVVLAVRGAAKVFRIGVLVYGKPPDFKTLLKWARMA